jgi:hypothetical protein
VFFNSGAIIGLHEFLMVVIHKHSYTLKNRSTVRDLSLDQHHFVNVARGLIYVLTKISSHYVTVFYEGIFYTFILVLIARFNFTRLRRRIST